MHARACVVVSVATVGALLAVPARAEVPYPNPTHNGSSPYDYAAYAYVDDGDCATEDNLDGPRNLPSNFDCRGDWKFTNYSARLGDPDFDPAVASNPAELGGVKGSRVNLAWEVTTGRPDLAIAVLDSGIRWDGRDSVTGEVSAPEVGVIRGLRRKLFLNSGELPRPQPAECREPGFEGYDRNCDGIYNVVDHEASSGCTSGCVDDRNGNGIVEPEDLILAYSNSIDDDGNGYPDDISGWDFFEADNDPNDDTDHGHGTGEALDSGYEAGVDDNDGMCPNCMVVPLRVGDSFIADVNHFGEAVVYATDNGASVVQEALGTLNNTSFGKAAVDYAYRRGVIVVASAADESAGHHNYPSNYNHTMVVNSVTKFNELEAFTQAPKSYLYFNGCTNFGGHTHMSVPSAGCSSEATGRSAGYSGLLYSAAANAVDAGLMTNYVLDDGRVAHYPLSAQEAMQIFRAGAEDIDFSPPHSTDGWATAHAVPSRRFQSVAGWDMFFGYGRVNANAMLRRAGFERDDSGEMLHNIAIPPEADITQPAWFAPLADEGDVAIRGRVAANRSPSFSYRVQWAPGVQPNPVTGDEWTTVASGRRTRALSGRLATLDMAEVAAAVDEYGPTVFDPATDPTSSDLPEKPAFRVRVTVTDAKGTEGVFQKQFFVGEGRDALRGWPKRLSSDGAGSPAFADLDRDGIDELIVSTADGLVHAFNADGSEVPGWPVRTRLLDLPDTGDNAYTSGAIDRTVYGSILLGSPAIGDIVRGDGKALEVAVADLEGRLYVFDHNGRRERGFPVSVDRSFSEEPGCEEGGVPVCDDYLGDLDVRDRFNAVDHGFNHNPIAADIDGRAPGLELVAGAGDNHVYAWHADGSPVPGWPVFMRDPTKLRSVHPLTHKMTYEPDAGQYDGSKVIVAPSAGDVDGDGDTEIVATVNEGYQEEPNASRLREQLSDLLAPLSEVGNGRVYVIDGRGSDAGPRPEGAVHPHPQAYLPGWPARVATIAANLLPYVGEGPDGAPTLADVDDDGDLEIGIAMQAGPGYILDSDGTSHFGEDPEGRSITLATAGAEYKGTATDAPSFVAVGGGSFGELKPGRMAWTAPAGGLIRLLDVVLAAQQLGAQDELGVWDASTGTFFEGFPVVVNDLQFFAIPSIADVSGDGVPEVLEGTATYDVRAVDANGSTTPGWPKFTGGWVVSAVAVGDLNGDRRLEAAVATREGLLFVWMTNGDACQPPQWPKYQHDLHNSGNYENPVRPPASCKD